LLEDKAEFIKPKTASLIVPKLGHVLSLEPHCPMGWNFQPAKQVEERGLTRSGWSQDSQELVGTDFEVDILTSENGSPLVQILQ
jgi:hypothetical protein